MRTAVILWSMLFLSACSRGERHTGDVPRGDWTHDARNNMVDTIANYSPRVLVTDKKVLDAMRRVPRHEFVPDDMVRYAYLDRPLPIGQGQTISQPLIVGFMTQALELQPHWKVLEIGTGSGYQAAILAEIAAEVFTIEIIEPLGLTAAARLKRLGYRNIHVKIGDGYRGWPEHSPFDAVIVTCSPDDIPKPLIDQLKTGGLMIIPVENDLILLRKTERGIEKDKKMDVRFVPMTGEAQKNPL